MKLFLSCLAALLLASCVSNVDSARLVLSEPDDSASIRTLSHRHELHITEGRMLVYNGEEKFVVPDDQLVVFEIVDEKEARVHSAKQRGAAYQLEY